MIIEIILNFNEEKEEIKIIKMKKRNIRIWNDN